MLSDWIFYYCKMYLDIAGFQYFLSLIFWCLIISKLTYNEHFLSQEGINILVNVACLKTLRKAFYWSPILVNKKFFEIPANVGSLYRLPDDKFWVTHQTFCVISWDWQFDFQPVKYRMLSFAVYNYLKRKNIGSDDNF